MNRDEAYKILYHQEGELLKGSCNHSEDVIDILVDIIQHNHYGKEEWRLDEVDRWNIYMPDSLHIVYTIETIDTGWADNFNDEAVIFKSSEVVVPIAEFASRWRDKQLTKIGV